ncbi:MAG: TIGR02710 family CRISPR-associated CARF protein [Armatimonadota bacterium]
MKGMVVTVGTGEGVHEGIARSIEYANPDDIIFVVTKDSRATLERIAKKLESESSENNLASLCRNENAIVAVSNHEDINRCYEAARDALKKLADRGLQPGQMVADFTSGTKAMSAGLVMAAVQFGCNLSYVGGGRNRAGRVTSGEELVHTGQPSIILIDLTLKNAVEAFNRYQFGACQVLIEGLKERISPKLPKKAKSLSTAAKFYEAWDRFDHKTAYKLCKKLKEDFDKEWGVDTDPNRQVVACIANAEGDKIEKCKNVGDILMADILANAERRSEENRYDDAVARLYRVIELAAQVTFARKYDFSTGRVRKSFLRKKNLESKYTNSDQLGDEEHVKLGLCKAYELLADLGEDLGKLFINNEGKLQKILQSRNESILAHGLSTVGENAYKELLEHAKNLCRTAGNATKLDQELKKCRFPKIKS